MRVPLEADDSLAVEAAVAELFACLAYAVRLNNGVNARGDRAIGEHARDLGFDVLLQSRLGWAGSHRASPPALVKGSTAIEGLSGSASMGRSVSDGEFTVLPAGRARHVRIGSEMFFRDW